MPPSDPDVDEAGDDELSHDSEAEAEELRDAPPLIDQVLTISNTLSFVTDRF